MPVRRLTEHVEFLFARGRSQSRPNTFEFSGNEQTLKTAAQQTGFPSPRLPSSAQHTTAGMHVVDNATSEAQFLRAMLAIEQRSHETFAQVLQQRRHGASFRQVGVCVRASERACVRACVCVRARARACVCVWVCAGARRFVSAQLDRVEKVDALEHLSSLFVHHSQLVREPPLPGLCGCL
jgi:hypothetical protein